MLAELTSLESIISIFLGGFMLYFPYLWCRLKHEPIDVYGLQWFMTKEAWRNTIFVSVFTLIPLTPIAVSWQRGIPYDLEFSVVAELLSAGIAAAFIEETFFRGFLQTILTRKVGAPSAIFLAATAFGATHLIINPSWLRVATFFPGLIMGWLRWRHGSVMPAILYHAFGNVWSVWFFPR